MQIVRVDVVPLKPSIRKFERKMARGVMHGRNVLLRLHTDDGIIGYGEVYCSVPFQHEDWQSVTGNLRTYYGPLLLKEDPLNIQHLMSKFDQTLPGNNHARAAIDFALFDTMGKALGVPVYDLMGGLCREKIQLEYSVGAGTADDMVRESLRVINDYRLKHLSLKVGPADKWKDDIENFKAVRKAVGDDACISIDANATYTVPLAIKVITELENYHLDTVEQPVPGWDLRGMKRVRESVHVPIVGDESVFSIHDAMRALQEQAVDVICVKLPKVGGLFNAKKIAYVAESGGVSISNGGAGQTGIGAAACVHFYASTANICPGAEFITGLDQLNEDADMLTSSSKFQIKDGCIAVRKQKGLGVNVNEEAVSKYAAQEFIIK